MSLPFLVGATSATDQARGIYYTPITFRAVTRPTVPTIDTILYMQELDETVYASMKTEKQYQLMDKRDGKMYFISKLKDGNVWMTQNLDFDLYDGITLYPETSDVLEEKTMDLTEPGKNSTSSQHYYYYDNYMYDQGNYYCPNGFCYNSNELVSLDTLEPSDKENHYALGNRYSWSAATADYFPQCIKSSINSNEYNACYNRYNNEYNYKNSETSICPAGWTLPSSASLSGLTRALGFSGSSGEYPIFASPIYLVGNGYIYTYESSVSMYINNGSNYAYYWTSTNYDSSSAYLLYSYLYTNSTYNNATGTYNYYPYSGYISGSSSYGKYYLLTIRCTARAPRYYVEYYMNTGPGSNDQPFDKWESEMAWSGNNIVKPKTPNRPGYKFLGWGTSPKTVEPRYYVGESITLDAYNTKLYAVWEELADDDMMEGQYSFEAIFRRAGKTKVDGYYLMQDLDSNLCEQVETGSETTLKDSRDGKLYEVAKMPITPNAKYGACWMYDNLQLGSKTESYTLTSDDSDVTEDFVVPAMENYLYDSSNNALIMDNDEHLDSAGRSFGYLYNYNLITAGTYATENLNNGSQQVASASICPKNWTLPRYGGIWYSNSEKQMIDNIEPSNYSASYYYSSDSNKKYYHILDNFYKNKGFYTRYANEVPSYGDSYMALKDYVGSNIRFVGFNSGNIWLHSSTSPTRMFSVRCMVPVDYEIVNTQITYYANYSGPNTNSISQKESTKSTDSTYYITIQSPTTWRRPGFQFVGWSERSNATVPDYYNGDIMELPTSKTELYLYAVWRRIENVNIVTFDDAFEAAGMTKHGNHYAMQDMTPEICNMVSDGQQGRLVDLRDNNVYWVGRVTSAYDIVNEGECWMTQNLDFEVSIESSGTTLTPELSDVAIETTTLASFLPSDTDNRYYGYLDGGDYYLPDGGLSFWEHSDGTNLQYVHGMSSTDGLEEDDERWHYHVGSFYAWTAATATTNINNVNSKYRLVDVEQSICPKGWTIPHYSYNSTIARSYDALSSYILPSMNAGYNNIYFADPFYPVMFGYIYPFSTSSTTYYGLMSNNASNTSSFGSNAYYWTANVSSDRYPYTWYYYKYNTYSDYTDIKNRYSSSSSYSSYYNYNLMNLRCVARGE